MDLPEKLLQLIPNLPIPKGFAQTDDRQPACLYLVCCTDKRMLFIEDSFAVILGYSSGKMLEGGLAWAFSIVHPDDLEQMVNEIFQLGFLSPAKERLARPFSVKYRAKNASGNYVWIRETKCILSLTTDKKNEYLLGRYEDITETKKQEEETLKKLLEEDSATNPMLKAALPIIDPEQKMEFSQFSLTDHYAPPKGIVMPTKRELEILKLIGEGFSTKQVADKLFISINTVETHRRHLLEKMQVKNSMELVKKANNASWLKAAI